MMFLNTYHGFYVGPGFYHVDLRLAKPFNSFRELEATAKGEGLSYWVAVEPAGESQQKILSDQITEATRRPVRLRRA